jgi:hypothetical protein
MDSLAGIIDAADEAIRSGDEERIARSAYDLETAAMLSPDAVRIIAAQITRWLSTDIFRNGPGVWRILFALRDDLDGLSDEDRKAFFLAMIDSFPYFEESMSRFIVSELAELFATDWSIDAFDAQVGKLEAEKRQSVPHAFEHIARAASDDSVAIRAFNRIVEFLRDPDQNVKGEALLSMRRIANSQDSRFADIARIHLDQYSQT